MIGHDGQGATTTHLMFVVAEWDVPGVAALRHRWDPVMAAGVPPHVTVAYPEEHHDRCDLLIERAGAAAAATAPFPLELGEMTACDDGAGGVMVAVSDPSRSWDALRRRILEPPLDPVTVEPHLTIVHPRTSDRGEEAWEALRSVRLDGAITARHLMVTTTHPTAGLRIARRFPLGTALDQTWRMSQRMI